MRNLISLAERYEKTTSAYIVLTIAYIMLMFAAPTDRHTLERYHINATTLHEILLAIIVPYIIIWVIAFAGYLRLRGYADSLGNSPDGRGFRRISTGVLWLTFWLPLSNVVSSVVAAIHAAHPSLTPDTIRFLAYANVVLLIPAFVYVYWGVRHLIGLVRVKETPPTMRLAAGFLIFAILYTTLVLHDPYRQAPLPNGPATYYLPDWLLIITLIIPRLVFWFLGVMAVQGILMYRQRVAGVLYKHALRNLAWGLGAVISGSVALRVVQSLTASINHLNLGGILAVVYLLILLLALGYVYIARGAGRLQQIEDL